MQQAVLLEPSEGVTFAGGPLRAGQAQAAPAGVPDQPSASWTVAAG